MKVPRKPIARRGFSMTHVPLSECNRFGFQKT
jgi:hypothetical protein